MVKEGISRQDFWWAVFSCLWWGVPVSHPPHSHRACIAPGWIRGFRNFWMGRPGGLGVNTDDTCGSQNCKTRRQPEPWLPKDGPNSFYLGEFAVCRRNKIQKQLCFGLCQVSTEDTWRVRKVTVEKRTSELRVESWVKGRSTKGFLGRGRRKGPDRMRLVPRMVGGCWG